MLQDVVTPRGPYRLALMTRSGRWSAPLAEGGTATAWQLGDGRVVVRAQTEAGLAKARFMLALDDDTGPFHARFGHDPLLGPAARALVGFRPLRKATVAQAAVRGVAGQLVQSSRARDIERAIARACGDPVQTQAGLLRLSPARLRALGLATHRASALLRLARAVDLERLRSVPTAAVVARVCREPGLGPWTAGVIALEGLGRFEHGLVGDLELVKLASALRGRAAGAEETAGLLAPYGEWQGLAGALLMAGWRRGLVPGADPDVARLVRGRARQAA